MTDIDFEKEPVLDPDAIRQGLSEEYLRIFRWSLGGDWRRPHRFDFDPAVHRAARVFTLVGADLPETLKDRHTVMTSDAEYVRFGDKAIPRESDRSEEPGIRLWGDGQVFLVTPDITKPVLFYGDYYEDHYHGHNRGFGDLGSPELIAAYYERREKEGITHTNMSLEDQAVLLGALILTAPEPLDNDD